MKLLVTGGSGFIGHQCIKQLSSLDVELYSLSSRSLDSSPHCKSYQVDLHDTLEVRSLVRRLKPTHLLHLAWCTTPDLYWTDPSNLLWVQSTLSLFQSFVDVGGIRIVAAGTCAEYQSGNSLCTENVTPTIPATLYGASKYSVNFLLDAWARQCGISYAWGRIFSTYGPRENPARLVPSLILSLLESLPFTCTKPWLIRDYLHSVDVARAFLCLLFTEANGTFNIGSAHPLSLSNLCTLISNIVGKPSLLHLPNTQPNLFQDTAVVACNAKLLSTGWTPFYTLNSGIEHVISWWIRHRSLRP